MKQGRHGKRDEIAFRGSQLGAAKTRAEGHLAAARSDFKDMERILLAWADDGITIDPGQITFEDDVDQAAWKRFCLPVSLRSPLEPPLMDTEDTILKAVQ